ncbi:MAG: HAD hydrolase-like protein [Chloroflexi bacterium]|nr:HAD hydrolase-like protein [Chloroflexota bacterium]
MTLTLLIDLDDTLLTNNIETFLPAYLKALGRHMVDYVAPESMTHHLMRATKAMVTNNTADLSLERSFDGVFYPAIGRTKEELQTVIEKFYDDVFPQLQPLTSPRPEAVKLVEGALHQGHTLVVATNPLFPKKAILHRLRWAGLDPDEINFALITTYECFHYAKPNPAYFAEILAQLGWPSQPAVVIGNSLEDDLIPAACLGLPVYWVIEPQSELPPPPLPEGFHPLSASGSLAEIPAWIDRVDAAGLRQEFKTPQAMLAVLKSTPAAMDTLCLNLNERQWKDRPQPNAWSLTEIICHLRDVDREVNIPRMERVIQEKDPFVPGVNSDQWAEERKYFLEDGPTALREFIEVRGKLITMLEELPEASWQLPARHAIFGPTRLQELVSFTAMHDRTHVQQALETIRTLA